MATESCHNRVTEVVLLAHDKIDNKNNVKRIPGQRNVLANKIIMGDIYAFQQSSHSCRCPVMEVVRATHVPIFNGI